MSESSLQGLLRQTVELLLSHPIIIFIIFIIIIILLIPWSQLARLLVLILLLPNSIPVLLCAFCLVHLDSHLHSLPLIFLQLTTLYI